MPIVDLAAIPQVPLDFMNEDHRVEAQLLNDLGDAVEALRAQRGDAEAVLAAFEALYLHTQEHFGREEETMRRVEFPPYAVHKMEHDRVLAEMMEEVNAFRASGDANRLWTYVSHAMPAWFVGHIQSMDHVTAGFVTMRGG